VTIVETATAEHRILIRKIQNRPPAWVTLVISLLTFALGWTVNAKTFSPTDHGQDRAIHQRSEDRGS